MNKHIRKKYKIGKQGLCLIFIKILNNLVVKITDKIIMDIFTSRNTGTFSDDNAIKLEASHKKKIGKMTNTGRLKNI